jgi:hypothetical protein
MRRAAFLLPLLLVTSAALAQTQHRPATSARTRTQAQPPAQAGAPPHAWLFGVWTGGLFPVLDGMAAQDCKAQPTVVFGRDAVGHSTLLGNTLVQRVIETVRTTPAGAEFRFTPGSEAEGGFGCEDPNTLHVARESIDVVTFPRCTAFPYPLHRCGT